MAGFLKKEVSVQQQRVLTPRAKKKLKKKI